MVIEKRLNVKVDPETYHKFKVICAKKSMTVERAIDELLFNMVEYEKKREQDGCNTTD